MQNIVHFLRNMSLSLRQLEHYSSHTSNQTYFPQTTPYHKPTKPQLQSFPRTKA